MDINEIRQTVLQSLLTTHGKETMKGVNLNVEPFPDNDDIVILEIKNDEIRIKERIGFRISNFKKTSMPKNFFIEMLFENFFSYLKKSIL